MLLVCIVHLKAKKDYEKRADELYMVSEEIKKFGVKKTFLMGDFNEEQDDIEAFLTSTNTIVDSYRLYVFQKFLDNNNIKLFDLFTVMDEVKKIRKWNKPEDKKDFDVLFQDLSKLKNPG